MDKSAARASGDRVVVIGAGIGGLCAALELACAGLDVIVVEAHANVGGKMRQVPSLAGPVDAGPTVLTMRPVFDELFRRAGVELEDHVTLIRQDILARHWWPDGTQLDLLTDHATSVDSVSNVFGPQSAGEFDAFTRRAARLFNAFDTPMMRCGDPKVSLLALAALSAPSSLNDLLPWRTLAGLLDQSFSNPRLRQLFGRYATYVGGSPYQSPALLSLIWHAEAQGVWVVHGGMHQLAKAIAGLLEKLGGSIRLGTPVSQILVDSGGVTGVFLADGQTIPAHQVIHAGDPRALALGMLGQQVETAKQTLSLPRSLSASVWSFAAAASGKDFVHHNVLFCHDPKKEFDDLRNGQLPNDPTLYVCAQDRGAGAPPPIERFEIIMNAPPLTQRQQTSKDFELCRTRTFDTARRMGLTFDPIPGHPCLATAETFETLFPGSAGSLYGQSPHGMTAALSRPRAKVPKIAGLYLAGGGTHPGAGVPMAALSGRHAAEAIIRDLALTSPSRRTATPGGMSTGSPIAGAVPFRSSGS